MKSIKIIIMVLSLSVMNHFASAQHCPGNKVLMSIGVRGACGCNNCQKKCVSPGEVQSYLDLGWRIGECPSLGTFCCFFVRNSKPADNTEAKLTGIQSDPVSRAFTISFDLSKQSEVNLSVFDMSGRYVATVANKTFDKDHNEINWNASKLNTGIYFLKMNTDGYTETRKITVTN